ncbi:MAG TPA: DUF262 domain-containing protein [Microbacteriaceae bacterium]|nr:DUF262 domain-containing protein [Microbacteriaceae bacterium]
MAGSTNVEATAVGTLSWLAAASGRIAVPVYQRQYRWETSACAQLLADVRAAADGGEGQRHFLGSILSAASDEGLILIDGQQRVTTLMLLVAALRHAASGMAFSGELDRVLLDPADPGRTRLHPHRAWAGLYEAVVLDRAHDAVAGSRFEENYTYFRSQVAADDPDRIWRGLSRLEHVAITLLPEANAQQIFESLNSTGAPLRDHELIHNYVLMGLAHEEQTEVEDEYWAPIERATGERIGAFFHDLVVLTTGIEPPAQERAVYDAFRREFPRLGLSALRSHAAEWRELAEVYALLLDPSGADDLAVERALGHLVGFGSSMHPLTMLAVRDWRRGALSADALIETLTLIESLLLRRMVVGTNRERLVARLCRKWAEGPGELARAMARITPSDERIRLALRYRDLPVAGYVLSRLESVVEHGLDPAGLLVDHVFPIAPGEAWSGDGVRAWRDLSDDEQNSLRALQQTAGNLALVEEPLADALIGRSFADKAAFYARSDVPGTRALAELPAWGSGPIGDRSGRLAAEFVRTWPRAATGAIDDDGLTPILDAARRPGWYRGWEHEFDYVEYRGEHWEVHDLPALFARIYRRLWTDHAEAVLAFSAANGGPVFDSQAWASTWIPLGDTHWLTTAAAPQYLLRDLQGVLSSLGLADEVFVCYEWGMA